METLRHTLAAIVTCALCTPLSYTCAVSAGLPSLDALFLDSICVHPHHPSVPSEGSHDSHHSNIVTGIHLYHITMLCFLNGNLFKCIFTFVTHIKSTLAEFEFYQYIEYIVILS